MIRWIKQVSNFDCVPIAFLNILKWSGKPVTYKKDFKKWARKLKCDRDGTSVFDYEKHLYTLPHLKAERVILPCILDIEFALSKGSILFMGSAWFFKKEFNRHAYLIVGQTKNYFKLVSHGYCRMEKNNFKELYLERHDKGRYGYPIGWIIKKKSFLAK